MAGSGILYPKYGGGGGVIVVANPKPLSSDGWTDPFYYSDFDTRTIYVASDAADDSANGLTPLTPKKTIAAAETLMRAGFADHILLKRGLTWTSQRIIPKPGRDSQHRNVYGTWGVGDRPRIRSGIFNTIDAGHASNTAFLGLDLDPHGFTGIEGINGLNVSGNAHYMHVEDCLFRKAYGGIKMVSFNAWTRRNILIRRNVFMDIQASAPKFIDGYNFSDSLIEENIFDNAESSYDQQAPHSRAINTYFNGGSIHLRKNVFTRLVARVCRLSGGGIAEDNFAYRVGGGFKIGNAYTNVEEDNGTGFDLSTPGGVKGSLLGNFVLERLDVIPMQSAPAHDISQSLALFEMENMKGITGAGDLYNYIRGNMASQSSVTQTGALWKMYGIKLVGLYRNSGNTRCCVEGIIIDGNKLVDHMATDGGKQRSIGFFGVLVPGGGLADITFVENDFQEAVATTGALLEGTVQNSYVEVAAGDNRFYRAGGANRYLVYPDNVNMAPFSTYQTQFGDSTSTETNVTYANRSRTMDDYAVSIGLADADALIAALRLQHRYNWDPRLHAPALLSYFRGNFE